MPISRAEFEGAYPVLFHISLARDVEQIMRHGLLSTTALLDLCEIEAEFRSRIEAHRRPKAISISHPIHGEFLINDQAPMNASALAKCLIDLTPQQWCESLNNRVFLWPTRERVTKHIGAKLAVGTKRIVLAFDTRSLFETLDVDLFELSPINSGNTMRKAAPRGSSTFRRFRNYPFHERSKSVGIKSAIAEVTYPYAITPSQLTSIRVSTEIFPGPRKNETGEHRWHAKTTQFGASARQSLKAIPKEP